MQAEGAFMPPHVRVVHDPDGAEPSEDVRPVLRSHAAGERSTFSLLDRYDHDVEGAGT